VSGKAKRLKPAVLTVGNELIYGERENTNGMWMLQRLYSAGMPAEIWISLPDDENAIGEWIRLLKERDAFPIFVSGGIGGTHDDRTRQGIALGLDRALVCHEECYQILEKRYGKHFSGQRKRMAWLPEGCDLIPNDIGAPGFFLEGIYAFPGFPEMLKPMFEWVMERFFPAQGDVEVFEWTVPVSEGTVGPVVERFSIEHPEVSVGIYPHLIPDGQQVTVRLRCSGKDSHVADELGRILKEFEK